MKNKLLIIFVFFILVGSSFSLAADGTEDFIVSEENGMKVVKYPDNRVSVEGMDAATLAYVLSNNLNSNSQADKDAVTVSGENTQTTMQQLSTLISLICMFQSQQKSSEEDSKTEQSASFCDGQFMQVMATMNSLSTAKTKTQASPGDDSIYVCEMEYKDGIETAKNCEVIDEDGYDLNYFFKDLPSGGANIKVTRGCHINKWKITSEEKTKNIVEIIFKGDCQILLKDKNNDYVIKNVKPNQDEPPYTNIFDLTFEKDKKDQLSGRIFFNDKWDKNIGFKVEKTKLEIIKDTEETFLINGHKFSKLTKGTIIAYPIDDRLTIEPPPEKDCYELEKSYGEYYEVCGDAEFSYDSQGTLVIGTRTVATIKGTPIGDVTLKPIEKGGVATLSIYDQDNMYLGKGSLLSDSYGNDIFASEDNVLIRNECYSKEAQVNFINYCYNPNTNKKEISYASGNGFTIAQKQESCYDSYSFRGGSLSFGEVIKQEKDGVCNKAVSGYPDSKTIKEFYGICGENSKLNAYTYSGDAGIDYICKEKITQYATITETSSEGSKCYTRNLAKSPVSSILGRIFNIFGYSIADITGRISLGVSCPLMISATPYTVDVGCDKRDDCLAKGYEWCYYTCKCMTNDQYNDWISDHQGSVNPPECTGSSGSTLGACEVYFNDGNYKNSLKKNEACNTKKRYDKQYYCYRYDLMNSNGIDVTKTVCALFESNGALIRTVDCSSCV